MSVDLVARALGARNGRTANTAALIAAIRQGSATRGAERLAANDIPVVTTGAAGAASTINGNGVFVPTYYGNNPRFTYVSGPIVAAGTTHPSWNYFRARGASYGSGVRGTGAPVIYEFIHSGTQFEIPAFGQGGGAGNNVRIVVNGALAGVAAIPSNTGQGYYIKVVFPASGTRLITIETSGVPVSGVNVANGAAEISSTGRTAPLVTMIGDSYAEGTGSTTCEGESTVLARALGFDCALAAAGGTGMINPGSRTTFIDPERLLDLTLAGVTSAQTGASAAEPRMGIVFGTLNDQGMSAAQYGPYGATLQDAIANRTQVMIDAWVTARTGRPLVFFGPTWPSGAPNNRPPLTIYAIRDGIMEAAWSRASDNVWFIDRLMPALREGIYSTASDQASLYTGTDTTHPTPMGHKLDGFWMASALRRLILSEFA